MFWHIYSFLTNIQSMIDRGLKAPEWIEAVCELVGGKGSGKDGQAQAVGNNAAAVDDAVQLARKLFETKISTNS